MPPNLGVAPLVWLQRTATIRICGYGPRLSPERQGRPCFLQIASQL